MNNASPTENTTGFQLHLVTDRSTAGGDLVNLASTIRAALRGGLDCVQVREKKGPASRLHETALSLLPLAREEGANLLVNDRLDVALACGADGVHLPGAGLPPGVARALLGAGPLVGVSVHGLDEARAAVEAGADYVTFGHVHPTASKPGSPPAGIKRLAEVVEGIEAPVLAVGGIDAANVCEVLATGAAGAAVISAILTAEDPESETLRLREAVEDSEHFPRYALPDRNTTLHSTPQKGGS
jgi:thiamine-phosphate pyrophosphorylase